MKTATYPGILALMFALTGTPAQAGLLGSVETGISSFRNVQPASAQSRDVSDSSIYSAGYVTAFHPLTGDRTAALAKMSLRHERFERSTNLTNNSYGGDFGIYHLFANGDSLMLTAGGRSVEFEDSQRDDLIGAGRLTYNHQLARQVKFSTELFYEQGSEDTPDGRYQGHGIAGSLNWSPLRVVRLILGVGYNQNAFAQPDDNQAKAQHTELEETSTTGWLGVAIALGRSVYCVGSVAQRRAKSDQRASLRGETYSFALGTRF